MGSGISLMFSPGPPLVPVLWRMNSFRPFTLFNKNPFQFCPCCWPLCLQKKLFSLDNSEETVEAAACSLWLLSAFSTFRVSGPRRAMCIGAAGKQEIVLSAPSEESAFLCHIHWWITRVKNYLIKSETSTVYCTFLPAFVTSLTLWRRNYFFLILARPVYKMWIIREPNNLALWNKLYFEEKKTESIEHV